MSTPSRIRRALHALELRRVAIEQQIIADMERKFFSTEPDEIIAVAATSVLPEPGLTIAAHDGSTSNTNHSVMVWIG